MQVRETPSFDMKGYIIADSLQGPSCHFQLSQHLYSETSIIRIRELCWISKDAGLLRWNYVEKVLLVHKNDVRWGTLDCNGVGTTMSYLETNFTCIWIGTKHTPHNITYLFLQQSNWLCFKVSLFTLMGGLQMHTLFQNNYSNQASTLQLALGWMQSIRLLTRKHLQATGYRNWIFCLPVSLPHWSQL